MDAITKAIEAMKAADSVLTRATLYKGYGDGPLQEPFTLRTVSDLRAALDEFRGLRERAVTGWTTLFADEDGSRVHWREGEQPNNPVYVIVPATLILDPEEPR